MKETGIKRKSRRVKRVVEGILLLILTAEEILPGKKKKREILTETEG